VEEGKYWYQSKTIVMNGILSLAGILTLVADALAKDDTMTIPAILMLCVGGLNIILRYFFTNVGINH
jgi:hypothetical protein